MSHPVAWPALIHYYPFGNTTAAYLFEDLAPEEKADVLLLGCGDPRSILFSLHTRAKASIRSPIDVTCCDIEPAILARNLIFFTLLVDHEVKAIQSKLWHIFFSLYLDDNSHALLVEQCEKLIEYAASLKSWRVSPYASVFSICSQDTLQSVRKMWSIWSTSSEDNQQKALEGMQVMQNAALKYFHSQGSKPVVYPARAAGPLFQDVISVLGSAPQVYWKQGMLNPFPHHPAPACDFANPTLLYPNVPDSRINFSAFPLHGFHLARSLTAIKSSNDTPAEDSLNHNLDAIIKGAFYQFGEWCATARSVFLQGNDVPHVRIRFYTGDALTFCLALQTYASSSRSPGYFVRPWSTALIELNGDDYSPSASHPAPSKFNVIDTSNLTDHVGLLNLLSATIPVMSHTPSSVIYTESLLRGGNCDAIKGLREDLCTDPAIFQILFGISPISSCFYTISRSSAQDIFIQKMMKNKEGAMPNDERVAWKDASLIDGPCNISSQPPAIIFETAQLSGLLTDMYRRMFDKEKWVERQLDKKTVEWYDYIHYIRQSFANLLVITRKQLPFVNWGMVMISFIGPLQRPATKREDTTHNLDMMCQLHLREFAFIPNIISIHQIRSRPSSDLFRRFGRWTNFPAILRIVLVVPRDRLIKYKEKFAQAPVSPGPSFRVDIECSNYAPSAFSSLNVCFGRIVSSPGPDGEGQIVIEEDSDGIKGDAPLVVSLWVPSSIIFAPHNNQPATTKFSLSLQPTPGSAHVFFSLLGPKLQFFTADLGDTEHLFFSRETPRWMKSFPVFKPGLSTPPKVKGQPTIQVALAGDPIKIATLTMHIDIVDSDQKMRLLDGAAVSFTQASGCIIAVQFSDHRLEYIFPYPIDGQAVKLRVARKSSYIEVIAPIWTPTSSTWNATMSRTPVSRVRDLVFTSWNIHHVVLDSLPVLNTGSAALNRDSTWYKMNLKLAFSDREYTIASNEECHEKADEFDTLATVKDGISNLFMALVHIKPGEPSLFNIIQRGPDGDEDCIRIVIINLRLDLASHTFLIDAFVLPSKKTLSNAGIEDNVILHVPTPQVMALDVTQNQMRAWRQLLPAFVERCRQWKHTQPCEYITARQVPVSYAPGEDVICSCGFGQDVDEFVKLGDWASPLASCVTRAAISPIFAVPYFEDVLGDSDGILSERVQDLLFALCISQLRGQDADASRAMMVSAAMSALGLTNTGSNPTTATTPTPTAVEALCTKCCKPGNPKLLSCSRCHRVKYCSAACQKEDWKMHKPSCARA